MCLFPSFVLNDGGAWSVVVVGTAIVVVVIIIAVVVVNDDDEDEAEGPIYDVCPILMRWYCSLVCVNQCCIMFLM